MLPRPPRLARARSLALLGAAGALALTACGSSSPHASRSGTPAPASSPAPQASGVSAPPLDVYANDSVGNFAAATKGAKTLVYVPNTMSNDVTVIDPKTFQVVGTYPVGREPQHVVPSWDLTTLYATNDMSNTLTAFDPKTGLPEKTIPVTDPYNLYFTPDGKHAIVMAEADKAIDFRDPHTFALQKRLSVPQCGGVDHADFSPDGSYMIATCEYVGRLVKVDLATETVIGTLELGTSSGPQDIKISPDGRTWYVADFNRNGLWEVDGDAFKVTGFLPTGPETHGLYPSRDGKYLYVANRGGQLIPGGSFYAHSGDDGSVSVVSFATKKVVATWPIPGGGTPDMGNVSADGTQLWLSGRRSNVVYVFDTSNGKLLAKIPVGDGPHGLCFWPEPGTYSLGHTGILR